MLVGSSHFTHNQLETNVNNNFLVDLLYAESYLIYSSF